MNTIYKGRLIGITILFILFCFVRVSICQDDEMTWFKKANEDISNEEKIICYLQAVRINPKFIEAYYNLGLVYKALEDYKKAGNAFQKALSVDPANLSTETRVQIIIELGILQKNLNLYSQALETLNTAKNIAQETENRAKILYEIGQVQEFSGDFNKAIDYFNEGIQLKSTYQIKFIQALQTSKKKIALANDYERGLRLLEQEQYEDAVQALKKVVDENPGYKDASAKLIEAQNLKVPQLEVDQLSSIYDRAIGFMQNEDWQNSILTFQQIIQVDSNYKDVKIKFAEAQTKLDQLFELQAYEKIYDEAISAYTERDWFTALTKFAEVLTWNPNFKDAKTWHLNTQAKLHSNRNDFQIPGSNDASPLASTGTLLPETQIDLIENESRESLTRERYEETRLPVKHTNFNKGNFANLTVATTTNSPISKKHHESWFIIGVILSITIVPTGVSFFLIPTSRAKLCLLLKNYPKAASIYESLVMKNPNKSKLYLTLAQIYLLQNRADNTAIGVYQFVLQQYEKPPMKETMKEIVCQKYIKKSKKSILDILGKDLLKELDNMGTT